MLIGILKCDQAPPEIIKNIGDYDKSILNFLKITNYDIKLQVFECHQNQLPTTREINKIDGWIITGSKHSCYENIPWIEDLIDLIRYLDNQKKKMVGLCFGHQIIAHALGARVVNNHLGWEVSVCSFKPNQLGQTFFDHRSEINLICMHKDIIVDLGESGLINLGGNRLCHIHSTIKNNHIFTLQGHPEYIPLNIEVLIELNQDSIPDDIIDNAKKNLYHCTNRVYLAKKICNFLLT